MIKTEGGPSHPPLFRKMRLRLTLLCLTVTGLILAGATCLCLYFSESGIAKNGSTSFTNSLNSILTHLESQNTITLQWIAGIEQNHTTVLSLYDNGKPLFYQELRRTQEEKNAISLAKETASVKYGLDLDAADASSLLSKHVEFRFKSNDRKEYYASVVLLPKANGHLSAVILQSLDAQKHQIYGQRFVFLGADTAALLLLAVFFWFFTGKTLAPLEENRRQQAQFIASASHELRSPLSVMLSCLTASQKAAPKDAARFTETIQLEGKRMSRLIDDMLQLAGADACSWTLMPAPLPPDTLLLDTYEKYEYLAREKGLTLRIRLPEEECPLVLCDEERIAQVLSILMDNALSYTPSTGHITLSLSFTASHVSLSVADDGPGIPDPAKKQVFQRFFRQDKAHTSKEHFGLGLSIAREIVKIHKGRLVLSDTPGGGATFTIILKTAPV